jgi:hypothetical protein
MSKKADLLQSPKQRLKRGKQHIRRLEKRIQTFFRRSPGERFAETDSNGFTVHGYRFARKVPNSWSDSGAEAIEALRSSLDQCGYAVAIRSGVVEPRSAYFPFGDSASDLDNVVKNRCKDLPAEIRTLFRGFESHQQGNYALWALNKLCNANKHRLLIPVGVTSDGMIVNRIEISGGSLPAPIFDRDKNQIVIARIEPGGHFQYDVQLSFYVGFDETNGVKAGPAVGILDAISHEVDKVVKATEAECKRIGLI